jgi:hypothetical protein
VTCTKTVSKSDLFLNCQRKMKELSKKELSKVVPASNYSSVKNKTYALVHRTITGVLFSITIKMILYQMLNDTNVYIFSVFVFVFVCVGSFYFIFKLSLKCTLQNLSSFFVTWPQKMHLHFTCCFMRVWKVKPCKEHWQY